MSDLKSPDTLNPRTSFSRLLGIDVPERELSEPQVLVVDDKPDLLDSLHDLVSVHGYQADKALGGKAAMQALRETDYDVVLLDLIMPGISGHDILDFAERENLAAKIIVVSGDSSFSGVKHALRCGAFDFVKKPYSASELIATLQTAVRQVELEEQNRIMERELNHSEGLHRFLVHQSPDLVFMLDRKGYFTFINDRLEGMLGYQRSELIGQHYTELVDEGHHDVARHVFQERRSAERAITSVEMKVKNRLRRKGGKFLTEPTSWVEFNTEGIYLDPEERTPENFVGTFGTGRDVSERKEHEEKINFQAYHDLLTEMPNRTLLKDRLELAIAQAKRNRQVLAVMFLDLDRFKLVNDTLGHTVGDRLLKAVSKRLKNCIRDADTLARFGGDEFAVLLPEVKTRDDVAVVGNKILDNLNNPFKVDGHELFVGASIGISMYPEAGDSGEALIQNADIAMYHVKVRGKNGFEFFSEEMNHEFSTRLILERELRNALAEGELVVHYQPQISLETGAVTGVEALVRWMHPVRGLVQPAEFLPVAEDTGLIVKIDEWVQHRAFADVAAWHKAGLGDIQVCVNVSPAQLEQEAFASQFEAILGATGIRPDLVKLEITENVLMRDLETVIPKLKHIRSLGVRIAIDDFGTGYSSLSYLQRFPINTLKIDRSFVHDIRADQGDASIINAIVAMARGLNLDLIAEGVENRTQMRYLRSQGCTHAQGYLFSRPMPAPDITDLIRENRFVELVGQPGLVTVG
jgi:diguanylate cyclase (GGDEF)-like protein/PAS domain S-box-containing protein